MAINLDTTYPGRTFVDGPNPRGTFKDSTFAGAFDGTPAQYAWARDMWAFLEILLDEAGISPSGTPDTAAASQRYDALLISARDVWPLWDDTHTYLKGVFTIGSDNKVYQSLQTPNLNKNPISQAAYWAIFEPIEVIDNLFSTDPLAALSAKQGKILKDLIDAAPPATQVFKGAAFLEKPVTLTPSLTAITFSSGNFYFDDGSGQATGVGFGKFITGVWAQGTAGGLDTGSVAPDTKYYAFAIYNPGSDMTDYIISASFNSPTLPPGFTKKEYRGACKTDGASQIIIFKQNNDIFEYNTPILDINNISVNNVSQFFTMSSPGVKCLLTLNAMADSTVATWVEILISDPDTVDRPVSQTVGTPPIVNLFKDFTGIMAAEIEVITDATSRIRVRTAFPQNIALWVESVRYRDLQLRI